MGGGLCQRQRAGVGVPNVFSGRDHQAAGDKPGIFTPLQHAGHPVDCRVGITGPNALDERARRIVVGVPRAIVLHLPFLQRFLGALKVERPARPQQRQHPHLEGRQGPPGVAIRHLRQELQRLVGRRDPRPPQSPFAILQRPIEQLPNVGGREGLELEHPAATHQGRDEREERVLRGRPHQGHHPLLHVGEQHILLGAVEVMQFVNEQQAPATAGRKPFAGGIEGGPQFLHSRRGGIEPQELRLRVLRQQFGQRGLARPGGTVKENGTQPVGLQHPPQQFAFPQEVLLTNKLGEGAGTHPGGKWLGQLPLGRLLPVEQSGHHSSLPTACSYAIHSNTPLPHHVPRLPSPRPGARRSLRTTMPVDETRRRMEPPAQPDCGGRQWGKEPSRSGSQTEPMRSPPGLHKTKTCGESRADHAMPRPPSRRPRRVPCG